MKKVHIISALATAALLSSTVSNAAIFVKIPNIGGDVVGPDGNVGWFVADSFSFGVEREMKESGEKGGTQDINIGVGELQECTISKSMDIASSQLVLASLGRGNVGTVEVCATDERSSTSGTPQCYLRYKLDRAFIKSWSVSGDADDRPTEEVAFYYNKITFVHEASPGNEATLPGWLRPISSRLIRR